MPAQKEPASQQTTFFRLAFLKDAKNLHTFGEKYPTRQAAQENAPAVNKARKDAGLKPGDFILQIKFERSSGRYVNAGQYPIVATGSRTIAQKDTAPEC